MKLGEILFKTRGYLPVPFIIVALIWAEPNSILLITGVLMVISGELIRIWGVSYAGGATRTRNVGAKKLVTNGPFAFVRNPLYLGNMLMYNGVMVLSGSLLPYSLILMFIFSFVQYHFIVKLEEGKLSELFGTEYLHYYNNVPRFFPKLIPYKNKSDFIPNVKGAIRSERSTFYAQFAVLMVFAMRFYLGA